MPDQPNTIQSKRPIAVDLFAGAGGMTLGFEQAGFDVLAAVEIDPIHCIVHDYNFPLWSVFCQDITTISGEFIRYHSSIKKREIDLVFGGPPCQGFSLIGKRLLEDPRNLLVFHFVRIVSELQPKYFVFENVKGMVSGQHQTFIQELIHKFGYYGYKVRQPYQVLNAAYYGVPQNRERLFLLGCREDLPLPNYPEPTFKPPLSKVTKCYSHLPSTPTVREALQDLPEIENYPELCQQDWADVDFHRPSFYGKMLRGIVKKSDNYSYPRQYNSQLLTSSLRTEHTQESIERFAQTPPGKTEPISRFHKLNPDGLCNTLRAGTPSSRGAYTSPRPIHPFTPRCITVREAARLHSYPDWFRFHATKWHGFRQIGNSVPPLLAQAVAGEIVKLLNVKPEKPEGKIELGDEAFLRFDMSQAAKYYGVNSDVIAPRNRKKKS
ncbi:DNA cytosine methyltransferase [Capilliphycus salinus ALCB114379]|uniref:DNA cytosine methyltransferase n=1 Tax=Capilliphycus salinus TaxID=2768948 RepID=UPI0039A61ACF